MYKFLSILLFAYGFAVTTKDIYDNSWAVIIGFERYEDDVSEDQVTLSIFEEIQLTLQARKFIDKRSGVGFGYSYYSWEGMRPAGYQEYASSFYEDKESF